MSENPPRPEVIDLKLCEQKRLTLRPGVLYRFTVDPKCFECNRLAQFVAPLTHRPGRAL